MLPVRDFANRVNARQIGLRRFKIGTHITEFITIEPQILHALQAGAKTVKHQHSIVGSAIDLAGGRVESVGAGGDVRLIKKLHPVPLAP